MAAPYIIFPCFPDGGNFTTIIDGTDLPYYMKEHHHSLWAAHFRDYVGELPHQWILDNLMSAPDVSRRIVSSAMIAEAADKFSAKAALVKRYKALSPTLRLKCAQVYLTGGNGLPLEDGGSIAKNPLLTSLLVCAAKRSVGASGTIGAAARLFGFHEFEPVLRPLMARTLADAGAAGDTPPHAAGCPWRPLNDVAAVCSLAFQGALSRSVHGGLSRSSINAVRKLVNDPTISGKSVAEDGASGHPAGFLIGYCLRDGLIADADREYRLCEQKFAAWLDKSMKDRMRKVADYAHEFLDGFNLELMRETLRAGDGRSLSVNFFVPESVRDAASRAVGVLEFFGYAHTPRGHSHGASAPKFSLVKEHDSDIDKLFASRDTRGDVLMPDFTVLMPQEASPSELFEFSKTGTLTGCDKVYKGKIAKESISGSLSAGTDPARIREWLKTRRAPTNVTRTVDEWIREFERLFVARGSILALSDERVAKQIAALEPLRKYLTKVDAHTVYMIRHGSEQKVFDMLEKLGFDTRASGDKYCGGDHTRPSASDHDHAHICRDEKSSSQNRSAWKAVTDFSAAKKEALPPAPMRGTKYGSRLKPLGISEMIHVIDYAMLTSQSIIVDYAGSASVKENVYTAVPVNLDKGVNAAVEAEIPGVKGRKKLFLDKISRIGVVAR